MAFKPSVMSHQLHCVPPISLSQGLVHEALPATSAVFWQLCKKEKDTLVITAQQWRSEQETPLVSGQMKDLITFDEVSNLGLYWSFLQVLDHHVGNSCQMTHVASPGAALSPENDRDTLGITLHIQNYNHS